MEYQLQCKSLDESFVSFIKFRLDWTCIVCVKQSQFRKGGF